MTREDAFREWEESWLWVNRGLPEYPDALTARERRIALSAWTAATGQLEATALRAFLLVEANRAVGQLASFSLSGKVKPYVRMTQRGKWTSQQAQEYLASKAALAYQFLEQRRAIAEADCSDCGLFAADASLLVLVTFEIPSHLHRSDLDNQIKAILDAMNGIIYKDDRQIDQVLASRGLSDDGEHRTRVSVFEFVEPKHKKQKGD